MGVRDEEDIGFFGGAEEVGETCSGSILLKHASISHKEHVSSFLGAQRREGSRVGARNERGQLLVFRDYTGGDPIETEETGQD